METKILLTQEFIWTLPTKAPEASLLDSQKTNSSIKVIPNYLYWLTMNFNSQVNSAKSSLEKMVDKLILVSIWINMLKMRLKLELVWNNNTMSNNSLTKKLPEKLRKTTISNLWTLFYQKMNPIYFKMVVLWLAMEKDSMQVENFKRYIDSTYTKTKRFYLSKPLKLVVNRLSLQLTSL